MLELTPAERAVLAHAAKVLAVEVRRGLSCTMTESDLLSLRSRLLADDLGRCDHPGLLPSLDAPHPRREREAYEAWLDRTKRCPSCGSQVPERDL